MLRNRAFLDLCRYQCKGEEGAEGGRGGGSGVQSAYPFGEFSPCSFLAGRGRRLSRSTGSWGGAANPCRGEAGWAQNILT